MADKRKQSVYAPRVIQEPEPKVPEQITKKVLRTLSLPGAPVWNKKNIDNLSDIDKCRYSITGWLKSSATELEQGQFHNQKKFKGLLDYVSRMAPLTQVKEYDFTSNKPKAHKAKIIIWSDINLEGTERLMKCEGYEETKQFLSKVFGLDNNKHNLKDGIILDLYYYAQQFAKKENFSVEKTSTFLSIIKRIFDVLRETPYGNLDHTYEYFKELLYCHSVNRPPISIQLFTHDDVVKIANYTLNTFFRNFKLYKYAFTPTVQLDLTFEYIGVLPPSPVSEVELKSGSSLAEYEKAAADEGLEAEDIDIERLQAEEELRRIVTDFLTKEAKKVENNIDQHLKQAVDILQAKIEPLIDTAPKVVKGKKK